MTVAVATFNARHGRPSRGLARLDLLRRQCAALGAEVLGLQEIDRRVIRSYFADQPGRLGRALGAEVAWAPARRPIVVGHEGNALLVRGTLHDVEIFELPYSPPRFRRTAILARTVLDGLELSVAVTHLHFDPPTASRQLPVLLERFAPLPEPRVLLGDLNLTPADARGPLVEGGYDVPEAGPTVPAHAPDTQIDFVAVRGAAIVSAAVHPTIVSDHRPLVAEIA